MWSSNDRTSSGAENMAGTRIKSIIVTIIILLSVLTSFVMYIPGNTDSITSLGSFQTGSGAPADRFTLRLANIENIRNGDIVYLPLNTTATIINASFRVISNEEAMSHHLGPFSPGAGLGEYVESAGDVNNDGYDDVLVSETLYKFGGDEIGRVMLFLGSEDGVSTIPEGGLIGDPGQVTAV